ncbi:MAG TPA: cytochrome c-type biogenesis CcmF C-terminal domain-containing protein [Polyangiaceae bacterium]|jgi:cytochrome c-type biogenesis protein CcmF
MWNTFPLFGGALLLCVMLAASYTFAVALHAGVTGRARSLQAARFGAYGTVAFIATAVFALAYAFVSHDFRLRYVAHYSDRSMAVGYLLTALWGGQDGSLLWWLFLLSLYIGACVKWLGKRYVELQPYVIATLMAIVVFFCILMTYSANPFATSIGGARTDGEGLNPLLQNFYMIIHPPSLYTGFVGCSIPFSFAVAALVTGRLDSEWIVASRKWTLFAWMFLAIGNTLGMLWAYEELGWGGYWAWDPVENAAFMPFLAASAFVHSVMIQERRGLLKVWNVSLICLTFFMTIFGTFLTRSGAIASVHSFAQSSIGTYFVYFLVVAFIFCFTLILYRWPDLRDLVTDDRNRLQRLRIAAVATGWTMLAICAPGIWALSKLPVPNAVQIVLDSALCGAAVYTGIELVYRRMTREIDYEARRPQLESWLSREFTFLLNNWALLGFMLFVLVATTFPMLSEAISGEKVTVGPPYYNAWVQPIGLTIFSLMGIGTLFGWKKTSPGALKRAFIVPTAAMVIFGTLHLALGRTLGFPPIVWGDAIYGGALGKALRAFNAITPLLGFSIAVFNAAVILQEFTMLFRSRRRSGAGKEGAWLWPVGFVFSVIAVLGLVLMRHSFPSRGAFGFTVVLGSLVALVAPYFLFTLISLPHTSRRRYGGYIVHFGLVLMFIGFTGKSWTIDREASMAPHDHYQVAGYDLEYLGPRMELDVNKRMIFGDVAVSRAGTRLGVLNPAKFMYKKMPDSPTTEVSMMHSLRDDLYLVVGSINPQTKVAAFQIHINPLVSWIWFGAIVLIFGSIICMWPELAPAESRVWAFGRGAAGAVASFTIGVFIAMLPAPAWAQMTTTQHDGVIHIQNDREHALFSSLRCMCGTCARDLLSTCTCDTAEDTREALRKKIEAGETNDQIIMEYAQKWGSDSLAVPPNKGGMRAIYAVPLVAFAAGGAGIVVLVRRWSSSRTGNNSPPKTSASSETGKRDDYDDRLDEELRDLDG